MQAVDVASRVADRLSLLNEVESINVDLCVVEERYGHHGDIDALRRRIQRVRLLLLTQVLCALLAASDTATGTIH